MSPFWLLFGETNENCEKPLSVLLDLVPRFKIGSPEYEVTITTIVVPITHYTVPSANTQTDTRSSRLNEQWFVK